MAEALDSISRAPCLRRPQPELTTIVSTEHDSPGTPAPCRAQFLPGPEARVSLKVPVRSTCVRAPALHQRRNQRDQSQRRRERAHMVQRGPRALFEDRAGCDEILDL